MHRKRVNISTVLAGQRVRIKEVVEGIWIVTFMHYELGYIDLEQKTLRPLDNPFGARLLPMSSVQSVNHVFRLPLVLRGVPRGISRYSHFGYQWVSAGDLAPTAPYAGSPTLPYSANPTGFDPLRSYRHRTSMPGSRPLRPRPGRAALSAGPGLVPAPVSSRVEGG
jgi:hypothetical protein